MIGCLRTRVRNQPIIALYFESENVLKLYNLEATVVVGLDDQVIATFYGSPYIRLRFQYFTRLKTYATKYFPC